MLPLFYQVIFNFSAGESGMRLMPYSFGAALGSLGYGYLMGKTGRYYWLGMSTFIFQFLGTGVLVVFDEGTPSWMHFLCIVPTGIGYGGVSIILLIALLSSIPIEGSF